MVASASPCTTGEVGSVGTVELVCVSELLRMGFGPLLMPVCGFVVGGKAMGAEWATMETFC